MEGTKSVHIKHATTHIPCTLEQTKHQMGNSFYPRVWTSQPFHKYDFEKTNIFAEWLIKIQRVHTSSIILFKISFSIEHEEALRRYFTVLLQKHKKLHIKWLKGNFT